MTYAFTQDVPINRDIYAQITDGLGPDAPPGLIAHLAIETDTGLRYLDIWASPEAAEQFAEDRLHPVVHPMLRAFGFDPLPPEPEKVPVRLVHAWIPAAGIDLTVAPVGP